MVRKPTYLVLKTLLKLACGVCQCVGFDRTIERNGTYVSPFRHFPASRKSFMMTQQDFNLQATQPGLWFEILS
ncbi:hypothetical protein DFH28DRAFT_967833 [Melampsora americana]|nr:hypothetical protein DFH28DRAFT_967833 [Melampsora americana]